MTDREKLVEILGEFPLWPTKMKDVWMPKGIEKLADHLIAHGVTVQGLDGCDYCQQFNDPCGVPMIAEEESDTDRGIYLYNGFLCANGGEFCEAKVNFCPMCGRKLSQPPKGE